MRLATRLLTLTALIALSFAAQAQTRVNVPQGFGTLNTAIANARTAGTAGNTVFVLQRNGVYLLDGTITNTGFTLVIEAAAGTGKPPVVQPGVRTTGGAVLPFVAQGNVKLTGLYLNGTDDSGSQQQRYLDITATNNVRVEITDCVLDYIRYAFIEAKADGAKVYVRNSIIRNAIQPGNSGNGRIVNVRASSADSVLIENSTIYNAEAGVTTSGSGFLKQLVFNHNTVFGTGNGLTFDNLSGFIPNQRVTNNIFANVRLRGNTTGENVNGIFTAPDLGPNGFRVSNRKVVFDSNNFFYTSSALAYFAGADKLSPVATEQFYSPFNTTAVFDSLNSAASPQSTIRPLIAEPLAFTQAPDLSKYIQYNRELFQEGKTSNFTDPYVDNDPDPDGAGPLTPAVVVSVFPFPINFSYPMSSRSYTAAAGGCPLGDLRWFPNINAQACLRATAGEETPEASAFALSVYPSPARTSARVALTLEAASEVEVGVYDLLGRQVLRVPAQTLGAGSQSVDLDVSALSSGVYLYRVAATAGGATATRTGKLIVAR